MRMASWNASALIAVDVDDAKFRARVLKKLLIDNHVIGVQEVHGDTYAMKAFAHRHHASHWAGWTAHASPNAGGCFIFVAGSLGHGVEPKFTTLVEGRAMMATIVSTVAPPLAIINVHNFRLSAADRRCIADAAREAKRATELRPSHNC